VAGGRPAVRLTRSACDVVRVVALRGDLLVGHAAAAVYTRSVCVLVCAHRFVSPCPTSLADAKLVRSSLIFLSPKNGSFLLSNSTARLAKNAAILLSNAASESKRPRCWIMGESHIPSRPPDARELFPTRVCVAPSGLSPPPTLSTLRGGSRCGVRVWRASCGASPIAQGASATPRSLPRSLTRNLSQALWYPQPHKHRRGHKYQKSSIKKDSGDEDWTELDWT
jgi:hypothetical protein